MSLRLRLVLGSLLATLVVSIALTVFAGITVERAVYNDVDRELRDQARQTGGPLGRLPMDGSMMQHMIERGRPGRPGGRELLIRIVDESGDVTSESPGAAAIPRIPAPQHRAERDHFRTFSREGTTYRLLDHRSGSTTVQLLRPIGDELHFLSRLRLVLILGAALAALASILLSWRTAHAALRPIMAMARTARSIQQTGDLSQRVAPSFADAEVRELSDSLNGMLESIQQSEQRQRQFVTDASHELKTPLTSLRGNAEYLAQMEDTSGATADVLDAAHAVLRDTDRLITIADGLTVLARLDADVPLELEPVRVDEVIADELARAQRVFSDHTYAHVASADTIVSQPELIRRIVSNLLVNAGTHTAAGTRVEVSTRSTSDATEIEVRDNGAGVDADEIPQLFDRFYRAAPTSNAPGTGLGLAIVAEAARALGGTAIASHSATGGLTIVVRIPASHAPSHGSLISGGDTGESTTITPTHGGSS